MSDNTANRIVQLLVERGWLSADKLPEVQNQLTKTDDLQAVLVATGLVNQELLAQMQAEVMGVPYTDLHDKSIPQEILTIIPESTARGHMIVAFQKTADALFVAMTDPRDRQIVEFLRKKVDLPVEVTLASEASLREALGHYQQSLEVELGDIIKQEMKYITEPRDLGKAAEDMPTIKITQEILKHAIVEGASDIHIEPKEDGVIIRYRIDGILHDVLTLPRTILAGLIARIKVLSSLKIDEHRLPQDGRFKIESDEYKVSFRVSTLPVYDGEKVVMRLLDESGSSLGLDDIGLRPEPLAIIRRAINRPQGMLLVTGPTGSGKTTTLYAVMKEISTADVNISTIEDPIEYRMPRVNQTQIKPEIGLTFSNGLRSLVRQDPDIIMVGEIRDQETASLAVNAALTGHLVFSTLHTNSAAGAIPRLRDMKIEAFLLASTLNMIIAQRLVRKLCPACRQAKKFNKSIIADLKIDMDTDKLLALLKKEKAVKEKDNWDDVVLYEPGSCPKCKEGYKGRIGIYEVMEVTPAMQQLIEPNVTSDILEKASREQNNMITMLEDGIFKTVTGITSIEEVMRVARE